MKLLLPLAFACSTSLLFAQKPGSVDLSYGTGGTGVATAPSTFTSQCSSVQPDDKLLMGGLANYNDSFSLIRQNRDGSPDAAFGNGGVVLLTVKDLVPLHLRSTGWTGIAVQTDGKIIAVGGNIHYNKAVEGDWGGPDDNDVVVVRFLPDGRPDSTFGNGGRVVTDLGLIENITSVVIQPDGKIVAAGSQDTDSDGDGTRLILLRYNTDGSLDTSFGNGAGYIRYNKSNSHASDVLLQPDGRIVTGGSKNATKSFLFMRFNRDGSVDSTFGDKGESVVDFKAGGTLGTSINGIAFDSKGRIIGTGARFYYDAAAVIRLSANGKPDSSFAGTGVYELPKSGYQNIYPHTVLPDDNGRLLIAGHLWNNNEAGLEPVMLTSVLEDGITDSSFGTSGAGYTRASPGSSAWFYSSAAKQSDGKILVSYASYDTNAISLTIRFNGYLAKVPLAVRIRRWLQNHSLRWNPLPAGQNILYYSVEQSAGGKTGFAEIARMNATGSSMDYAFDNRHLLAGINYYRVKAVAKNGTVLYSAVVSAVNALPAMQVYPNPVKDAVQVRGLQAGSEVMVYDAAGGLVKRVIAMGEVITVNINELRSGVYVIKVREKDRVVYSGKMVKE